jgi:hypothetical protein
MNTSKRINNTGSSSVFFTKSLQNSEALLNMAKKRLFPLHIQLGLRHIF